MTPHGSSRGAGDRTHAVVVGASMAGLLSARVLSDHFDRVTIIERDRLPPSVAHRQGVPQGQHAHGLLASGFAVMKALFPGLADELVTKGAVMGDVLGDCIWFLGGSYKLRFHSGLGGITLSRPLLESTIRRRTTALPRVTVVEGARVKGLASEGARVTGVRVETDEGPREWSADLVLDATGRGSRTPVWIESLGFPLPEEETVDVGISYTTHVFERRLGDARSSIAIILGVVPPTELRFGAALAMEGSRWMVTLGGFLGDQAPPDPEGFTVFAKSLSAPDIYELIRDRPPISAAATYKFPANRRRRYDQLDRFPEGYLVVGDGLCSFNPIYGQGMSVAALEAEALGRCLEDPRHGRARRPLWKRFFERAGQIADGAWTLAASADLANHGVTGRKPPGFAVANWYMGRVQDLAARDASVCRAFFDVSNLLAPPTTLFSPRIAVKALTRARKPPVAQHRA